jgi:hypothetical protein
MTASNIILFLLGFVCYILSEIYQTTQTGKPFIMAEHIWKFALSFVVGVSLLIMGPELITGLGVTLTDGKDAMFMKFHAFFVCGLLPLIIFKRIMSMIKLFTGNGNGNGNGK